MNEIEKMDYEILNDKILHCGNMAQNYIIEMAKNIKKMHDEKIYVFGGFESFEDYTTSELNLKARQAYNFIRVYEELGESVIRDNSQLGITKLVAIASADKEDREELIETASDKTVAELKSEIERLRSESTEKDVQLNLFAEMEEKVKDGEFATAKYEAEKHAKEEIQKEYNSFKIQANLQVKTAEQKLQNEVEKVRDEENERFKNQIADIKGKAKAEAIEEARTAVSNQKVIADNVITFKAKFDVAKDIMEQMIAHLGAMEAEDCEKCKKVFKRLLEVTNENI